MSEFPTGIVTLVFTDLEGSSGLWEQYRADFQVALQEHNRIIREAGQGEGSEAPVVPLEGRYLDEPVAQPR